MNGFWGEERQRRLTYSDPQGMLAVRRETVQYWSSDDLFGEKTGRESCSGMGGAGFSVICRLR